MEATLSRRDVKWNDIENSCSCRCVAVWKSLWWRNIDVILVKSPTWIHSLSELWTYQNVHTKQRAKCQLLGNVYIYFLWFQSDSWGSDVTDLWDLQDFPPQLPVPIGFWTFFYMHWLKWFCFCNCFPFDDWAHCLQTEAAHKEMTHFLIATGTTANLLLLHRPLLSPGPCAGPGPTLPAASVLIICIPAQPVQLDDLPPSAWFCLTCLTIKGSFSTPLLLVHRWDLLGSTFSVVYVKSLEIILLWTGTLNKVNWPSYDAAGGWFDYVRQAESRAFSILSILTCPR